MYNNPIARENLEKIKDKLHAYVVEGEKGFLASGLSGMGRMADINKIMDAVKLFFIGKKKDLTGKKILVTAGPTYEDIDPVRFIGNRSSGKMGYEIAKSAYLRGAEVTLITGPSSQTAYPEINLIKVRAALDMQGAVDDNLQDHDILIMSAAVADYRPAKVAKSKIKKEAGLDAIKLEKNPDILSSLHENNKFIVGFALETDNEKDNAKEKLKNKNLNMIILNSLNDSGSGFEHDTNKIEIFSKDGEHLKYPLLSKFEAANEILSAIIDRLQ
jgi:phosphopantothenoylcysteine decarboxylase/phosphopantothenate--cysteine ligase